MPSSQTPTIGVDHVDVARQSLADGTLVAGRYRIVRRLGAGGMGTVYEAEHLGIGRRVALKVLSAEWTHSGDAVRRFRAEARSASAIGHPNIVEVFDADELPDGRPFLVMELLRGRDLLSLVQSGGPLPWQRVCEIGAQVAHALAAAHERGIVHRDLKAENVMLTDHGRQQIVKVLDFGIAIDLGAGGSRETRPGVAVGTPAYMAPEQARGEAPTPAFDIYAFGALMHEMLVGEPPFLTGNPLEMIGLKLVSPAPSVATRVQGLPAALVSLVDACLATEATRRPQSAAKIAVALEAMPSATSEVATPPMIVAAPMPAPAPVPVAEVAVAAHAVMATPAPVARATPWIPWAVGAAVAAIGTATLAFLWPSDLPTAATPSIATPTEQPRPTLTTRAPEPVIETPRPQPAEEPKAPAPTEPSVEPAPKETPVATREPKSGRRATTARTDASPAVVADPPPTEKPAVAAPPETGPSEDACARARREAEDARLAHDWRGVLRHSDDARCWRSAAERTKLRVKANMELGRFSECVRLGDNSEEGEVAKWVTICRKRLAG